MNTPTPYLHKWISISARYSRIFFAREFEELGLGSGKHFILLHVCAHPGLTQEQIAKALLINKSTAARMISDLVASGHFTRQPDGKDKRVVHVYPTNQALNAVPKVHQVLGKWNKLLCEGLSPQETEIAQTLLQRITANAISHIQLEEESKSL